MLKYNIISGLKKNKWWYLTAFVFSIVCCALFHNIVENSMRMGGLAQMELSLKDNLIYILGGIPKEMAIKSKQQDIPVMWMAIQLIIAACIYTEPFYCNTCRDLMVLLKSESRYKYICRKIWSILLQVFIVYACIFAGALVYSVIAGQEIGTLHSTVFKHYLGVAVKDCIMPVYLIGPVIYSIMMAFVQMGLNMYLGGILSLVMIIGYHVAAVYNTTIVILGNVAMIFRSNIESPAIDITKGIALCAVLMAIAAIFLCHKFNRYDVI